MNFPIQCPRDPKHRTFHAYTKIMGDVKIGNHGEILNLEDVLGCELSIVEMTPKKCAECESSLVPIENDESLKKRIITEMALDEDEIKNFDLENYRCGLCWGIYDKCQCAKLGLR